MAVSVLFYIMSFVALVAALAVVLVREPVTSVLSLIVVFFNGAGLLILLNAEFLAVLLVIVYVGAIAVLFLFMVMMVGGASESAQRGQRYHALPLALLVAVVLLVELVLFAVFTTSEQTATPISESLQAVSNTEALGGVLYTRYAPMFQLAGLILLAAMLGAILLTHRRLPGVKGQDAAAQASVAKKRRVRLVDVKRGEGTQ
ncbi:MAG: NADH-quinone oxidoreductase subunit J [Alphaproteobacteria bacterium GM202ARS2]|nr:NADH-quinone oxidoreductase subunit J [Alphaproteobacteria bacterium GM202ARS2]